MWGTAKAALTGKFVAVMLTLIKRKFSNHSPKLPPKETRGKNINLNAKQVEERQ